MAAHPVQPGAQNYSKCEYRKKKKQSKAIYRISRIDENGTIYDIVHVITGASIVITFFSAGSSWMSFPTSSSFFFYFAFNIVFVDRIAHEDDNNNNLIICLQCVYCVPQVFPAILLCRCIVVIAARCSYKTRRSNICSMGMILFILFLWPNVNRPEIC